MLEIDKEIWRDKGGELFSTKNTIKTWQAKCNSI